MTNHVGWLWMDFGDGPKEILNNARTLAHLGNADISCARVSISGAECPVLAKHPVSGAALTFATPSTGTVAPWWDGVSGSPSSKAYGFWVDGWTGLDSSHIKRSSTAVSPRGAKFSKLGQGARIMKITLTMFGDDSVALEELFRWLDDQIASCDSACGGATAWWRTMCPGSYGDDTGLVLGSGAYVVEALTWLDNPIRELGAFMRRATFTLGLADPCLYTRPTSLMAETNMGAVDHCALGLEEIFGCPSSVDAFEPYQLDAAVSAPHIGAAVPVVYIENQNVTDWSAPLLIAGVEDPAAAGALLTGTVITGRVWLIGIPPSYEVVVDCARRQVLKRPTGTTEWEAADDLIDGLAGVPTFPSISNDDGYLIVRPTFLGNNLDDIAVTAQLARRYGCC